MKKKFPNRLLEQVMINLWSIWTEATAFIVLEPVSSLVAADACKQTHHLITIHSLCCVLYAGILS